MSHPSASTPELQAYESMTMDPYQVMVFELSTNKALSGQEKVFINEEFESLLKKITSVEVSYNFTRPQTKEQHLVNLYDGLRSHCQYDEKRVVISVKMNVQSQSSIIEKQAQDFSEEYLNTWGGKFHFWRVNVFGKIDKQDFQSQVKSQMKEKVSETILEGIRQTLFLHFNHINAGKAVEYWGNEIIRKIHTKDFTPVE